MHFDSHDAVAVLSLPSGGRYPRLTRAVLGEIKDLLMAIRREDSFHGVVIASSGASFATGADLEEVSQLYGERARAFAGLGQRIFGEIEQFPVPVVAAIRGYCLGGGLDLALACHARVASYDASFGHPGASLGLITGWGGTQRLPRLIGEAQALQMLVTGDRIPATQALTIGLIDELHPASDLIDGAVRRAEQLASVATLDVR